MNKTDEEIQEMEKEFERVAKEVTPQIQKKLADASALINEAVKLSEESGIPFRPKNDIMFCNPSYIPDSLEEKFPDIDQDFTSYLTNAWGSYTGWQQSQVC